MRKLLFLMLLSLLIITPFNKNFVYAADTTIDQPSLSISSPSALLMDFSTGEVIYEKNSRKKMYPASMTKMMAIYLFLECIDKKTHSFDDIVQVSTLASSMGGSQIFLKEHEKMSFEDLFKAVTIASANDAVVALAEHTYGSLDSFIREMNNRSKTFNMLNTNFVNVTGFHDENHYTTTSDMALLARKLLKDYGNIILKYTSIYETYLRENTSSPFWLVNTNRMIKYYQGMDGLKTGYTSDSGFNLTATASRNNLRFISVVMGAETSKSRNADTATLLDYGFANYKIVTLYKKGEIITEHSFTNASSKNTPIIAKEDITYVIKKNDNKNNFNVTVNIETKEAPITTEEKIGQVIITRPNSKAKIVYDIYSKENVEKLKFKDIYKNYWKALLS